MSTNDNNATSNPIPITGRARSSSLASSIPALSNSPTSPNPGSIATPSSTWSYRIGGNTSPHQRNGSDNSGAPGTSPTSPLAYFLGAATSPIRNTTGNGFPFNSGKAPPNNSSAIVEDESPPGGGNIGLFGVGAHTRRGSWAQNAGAAIGTGAGGYHPANDRATNVLRRLSISGAFQRPSVNSPTSPVAPPPTAVATSPTIPTLSEPRPGRKMRGATLSAGESPKKRSISPMGERLLKGHFDGFI